MKLKIISFLLIFLLIGCYGHIGQIEQSWGPPAKVEKQNDKIIYYYYFYKGKGVAYNCGGSTGVILGEITTGWIVWEIITNKNGKILNKRRYWKQPELK